MTFDEYMSDEKIKALREKMWTREWFLLCRALLDESKPTVC